MEDDYIILMDKHGDSRRLVARGGGEWVLSNTEHIGWRTSDDGTIDALDALGGPFIGVGAQLRSATGQLLTVSRIVRTPGGGVHSDDEWVTAAWEARNDSMWALTEVVRMGERVAATVSPRKGGIYGKERG